MERFGQLGTAPVPEDQATPEALKPEADERDRALEADHHGGRSVRRLTPHKGKGEG